LLVEVAFKGNRKEFFNWEGDDPLPVRAPVIVEADRGEDLGYVHATGDLAEKRLKGVAHAPEEGVTRVVRRLASAEEVKRVEDLRAQDDSARRKAMERVKANGLGMKLSDAEWRWDRRKLTIYFTADKRVDFRNLVRELASLFRTRIELRQIGVRDEAKRLGGIGRCGREYCSASWLPDLRPVNLGVARDQRLSLNPTQISGACGRLMCCLRYEHEFYVQQRKRFPKEGKLIDTSRGEEKVLSNDIFRERVTLRNAEGEVRVVPLAELRREWKGGPATERVVDEETPPIPFEGLSDEVLRLQDTSEMPAWLPRAGGEERGLTRATEGWRGVERRRLPVREVPARPEAPPATGGPAAAGGPVPARRGERPPRDAQRRGEQEGQPREDRPRERRDAPGAAAAPQGTGQEQPPQGSADGEERRRGRRRRGRRGGRRQDGGTEGPGRQNPPTNGDTA
jgi:cell fate regulator YaaT (PSP1 superfamily)